MISLCVSFFWKERVSFTVTGGTLLETSLRVKVFRRADWINCIVPWGWGAWWSCIFHWEIILQDMDDLIIPNQDFLQGCFYAGKGMEVWILSKTRKQLWPAPHCRVVTGGSQMVLVSASMVASQRNNPTGKGNFRESNQWGTDCYGKHGPLVLAGDE